MNDKAIFLSDTPASFFSGTHSFVHGGMNMEIKHTHPKYESDKQREAALKDTRRACINAISALKCSMPKCSA